MNPAEPPVKSRAGSFSLGTLFLIVTCAGVGSVAFRVDSGSTLGEKTALAMTFVGAFLSWWYVVTFRFKRLRYAGVASWPLV